jgi:hypothetical protein
MISIQQNTKAPKVFNFNEYLLMFTVCLDTTLPPDSEDTLSFYRHIQLKMA